jgi:UDP-glucuronate decarboxylase
MATSDETIGPINLGNPQEFSIAELAGQVIDLTGSRAKLVHRPRPEDDPRQRKPDISKAHEVLSWAPVTPLKEGLRKTIDYFDRLLREPGVRDVVAGS